jgi:hypothetical protein
MANISVLMKERNIADYLIVAKAVLRNRRKRDAARKAVLRNSLKRDAATRVEVVTDNYKLN